jgi:hypothetical protein
MTHLETPSHRSRATAFPRRIPFGNPHMSSGARLNTLARSGELVPGNPALNQAHYDSAQRYFGSANNRAVLRAADEVGVKTRLQPRKPGLVGYNPGTDTDAIVFKRIRTAFANRSAVPDRIREASHPPAANAFVSLLARARGEREEGPPHGSLRRRTRKTSSDHGGNVVRNQSRRVRLELELREQPRHRYWRARS